MLSKKMFALALSVLSVKTRSTRSDGIVANCAAVAKTAVNSTKLVVSDVPAIEIPVVLMPALALRD